MEHLVSCETVQTEGKRRYRRHANGLCSCCRKNPPKPGQRYCGECRSAYRRARYISAKFVFKKDGA